MISGLQINHVPDFGNQPGKNEKINGCQNTDLFEYRASCRNYEYFPQIVFGRLTVIIFYSIFLFFTRKRAVGYF